jgi:hypothetical protein
MEHGGTVGKMIELLTPLVGTLMAESTVIMSCTKAKANPSCLTQYQLDAIGKDIERRLAIFLGSEKAETVGRQVASIEL